MPEPLETQPAIASAFTVRQAREDEYRATGELTTRGFTTGPYAHLHHGPERVAMHRDAGARANDGGLLVAVEEGTEALLGTATVTRAHNPISRQARDGEAEMRLLAVDPAARGRGVAQALVQASIDLARSWGATALVLDTGPLNHTAQRNYLRAGFERVVAREGGHEPGVGIAQVYRYAIENVAPVRIRLVRPHEVDVVAHLTVEAYTHDYDLSESYVRSLADVHDRARSDEVWVAEDTATGAILGTVWTPRPGARISAVARDDELDFRLLAVAPDARGRGIGETLVSHVVGLGRIRGVKRVVMNTGSIMLPAQRLYTRLGFVRLPDREERIEVEPGRFVDIFAFGLDLD
ncbi:Ribosomal protein S18 acetylase RimI [Agreia bicolorata]|uniref:Ribosomal protein S18 acetylase RimI n=1 Tax=Agreia bicolorata TaxID=110935 RepID=A0A1T4X0F5_9MICO|nr:GNAT family N-acetyltransferase [Agreia bicolorata]SKA82897.1 Ribosomal protein S18 acetylase RimI [Agreia bicolorata]